VSHWGHGRPLRNCKKTIESPRTEY
jgi:hypothetical protein